MSEKDCITMERKLNLALDESTITQLAKTAGILQRERIVTPHRLAISLICALSTQRIETIADLRRRFTGMTGISVEYKPFHKQLAKEGFADFMREVLCHLMGQLVVDVLRPKPGSPLAKFDDILLHDGSSFAIHNALAERFPGRFTKHSPSAVELHATMSVPRDTFVRITLTPDTAGERAQAPAPETLRNKLIIKDRGYEDRQEFADIMAAGGSFLVRCKANVNPLVETCWVDGERIRQFSGMNLKSFRKKLAGGDADLAVIWKRGGKTVRYRIVLVWNPVHKSHMILATNLPADDFSVVEVRKVYAVRWQVELAFKEWKSYANLRKFNTANAGIMQGLIWAALAAALVKRFLAHAAQLLHDVATSTRIAAMCIGEHLGSLFRTAIEGLPLRQILRATLAFLAEAAPRAHKKRDSRTGRLSAGLEVIAQHTV